MTFAHIARIGFVALALVSTPLAHAKTLRWSSAGDITTMDPHGNNEGFTNAYLDHIYETLVTRGKELKVEPCLALSWENLSPTVTRFKLRQKVTFHDGAPFTADDVVFSIQRALSDTSNFKPYLAGVKEAKKVDDYTVDIVTDGPAPVLVPQLTEVRMMSRAWSNKNNVLKRSWCNIHDPVKRRPQVAVNGDPPIRFIAGHSTTGQPLVIHPIQARIQQPEI